jgi:hypothetical protein
MAVVHTIRYNVADELFQKFLIVQILGRKLFASCGTRPKACKCEKKQIGDTSELSH